MVEDESDLVGAEWYFDRLMRDINHRPLGKQKEEYDAASQTAHSYTTLNFEEIERFKALCGGQISRLEENLRGSYGC